MKPTLNFRPVLVHSHSSVVAVAVEQHCHHSDLNSPNLEEHQADQQYPAVAFPATYSLDYVVVVVDPATMEPVSGMVVEPAVPAVPAVALPAVPAVAFPVVMESVSGMVVCPAMSSTYSASAVNT